jgi:radical SAM protein
MRFAVGCGSPSRGLLIMIRSAASPKGRFAKRTRADFAQSPLLVFYEVTQACGLVCRHCRACAQTAPHPGELTAAESRRLIDQLTEFPAPPMLVLTGGDPLMRADIFELVEYASKAGLDVSITPSATPLVTEEAIGRLGQAGISRMAISIDGADAATHDATRGVAGSFDRSLRILSAARARGIPTQVNTTITPSNVEQIDEMAELLSGQGIALWSVFFLVPVGRANEAARLTAEGYELAFERLWRQSQRRAFGIKTTEAPHYRRYVIQRQLAEREAKRGDPRPTGYVPLGVNDGKGVMFISHVGVVHPSGFLPIVCGVFPQQHVARIYQDSPVFRGLRDANRLGGKCRDCEFRHLCGGSRARAYAVTGDLFAQEPDCSHQPMSKPSRAER